MPYKGPDRALAGQLGVLHELVGVLGVPTVNIDDDLYLALGPPRKLAHFTADVAGELIGALFVEVSYFVEDVDALVNGGFFPLLVSLGGLVEDLIAVSVVDAVKLVFCLACTRIF